MKKLFAAIKKEALLLFRDIAGLVILFVMPVFLVIVVTLAQEETLSTIQESRIPMLFVDQDQGVLSETIEQGLAASDFFEVKKEYKGLPLTEESLREYIAEGEFQIGIVVPHGASVRAAERARELAAVSMKSREKMEEYFSRTEGTGIVAIYFDPAIRSSYRNSVKSSLQRLVQGAEMRIMIDNFFVLLRKQMQLAIDKKVKEYGRKDIGMKVPEIVFPWKPGSLVNIKEEMARQRESGIVPTMIQNNVPGFALFAMFFVVIPFSGSIIIERGGGTASRMHTLPVSPFIIQGGKIAVYLVVCVIQMAMMIAVGTFVLPLFGITPLVMGSEYAAVFLATVASALAAIGFGMLVGNLANTVAQASMFGSVMVVIMAVMGGLMIPVYLMPEPLNVAGNLVSPIRWGIDAFLKIFARGGTFVDILPQVFKLTGFFVVSILVSEAASLKRQ